MGTYRKKFHGAPYCIMSEVLAACFITAKENVVSSSKYHVKTLKEMEVAPELVSFTITSLVYHEI
jgi:hypothetical protein